MTKKNPIRVFSGGRASRAEVYGLFIAAIVLVGGGVGGAIAIVNTTPQPVTTSTETTGVPTGAATASPEAGNAGTASGTVAGTQPNNSEGTTGSQGSVGSVTTQPVTGGSTTSSPAEACAYTTAEQTYYNNIRATKQTAVDQADAHVANVESWITSNTAHLEELLAAPYRPIEVFQRNPDGSPYVWRVDSNDEIAFERQRITDNEAELVRAQASLQQAIADRDQIPGC